MENLKKSIGEQIEAAKRSAVDQILENTSGAFQMSLNINDGEALMNSINSMDMDDIEIFVELISDAGAAINMLGDTGEYGLQHIVNPQLLIDLARGCAATAETPQQYSESLQNAVNSGVLPTYNVATGENIINGVHGRNIEEPENSISAVMRDAFKAAEMGIVMEPYELAYWQKLAVQNWGDEFANISKAADVPLTFSETAPIREDLAAMDQAVRGQVSLAESYGGIHEESLPTEEEVTETASPNDIDYNDDWDTMITPIDAPGPANRATVLTSDSDDGFGDGGYNTAGGS
jgi:hypothetical protein